MENYDSGTTGIMAGMGIFFIFYLAFIVALLRYGMFLKKPASPDGQQLSPSIILSFCWKLPVNLSGGLFCYSFRL